MFTDLHEESRHEGLPDVEIVVSAGEVGTGSSQVESVHDPGQLLPHVVRALQGSVVDEVVVAPLRILLACIEKYEDAVLTVSIDSEMDEGFLSNDIKCISKW